MIHRYAPDLAPRCWGLDFESDQLGPVLLYRIGTRGQMRIYARFYSQPALTSWAAVCAAARLYLVPPRDFLERGVRDLGRVHAGFTPQSLEAGLYLLQRTDIPAKPEPGTPVGC